MEETAQSPPVLVIGAERFQMTPDRLVRIGRSPRASVRVGSDDLTLSRSAVQMYAASGVVRVLNVSELPVYLSIDGGTYVTLEPGSGPHPLPGNANGTLLLRAAADHELRFGVVGGDDAGPPGDPEGDEEGPTTASWDGVLGLTERELRVLAAFAAPRLVDPTLDESVVSTSASVADRLGLTLRQLEDTIDQLALKFSPYLAGLFGSNARRSVNRRQLMVSFAIDRRIVTSDTLRLLPPPA